VWLIGRRNARDGVDTPSRLKDLIISHAKSENGFFPPQAPLEEAEELSIF
jgi:hypothetical protein